MSEVLTLNKNNFFQVLEFRQSKLFLVYLWIIFKLRDLKDKLNHHYLRYNAFEDEAQRDEMIYQGLNCRMRQGWFPVPNNQAVGSLFALLHHPRSVLSFSVLWNFAKELSLLHNSPTLFLSETSILKMKSFTEWSLSTFIGEKKKTDWLKSAVIMQ